MEGSMISPFSIVVSGDINPDKLSWELETYFLGPFVGLEQKDEDIEVYFGSNLTTEQSESFTSLVASHLNTEEYGPKILKFVEQESQNKHYLAIDYKVQTLTSLYPHRTFLLGELKVVDWYSDFQKTDLVLKTEIAYTRDVFGFATNRTTTRTWYDTDGRALPEQKITFKVYSSLEMIKEGKRRRGNIVDGVQLPVFSFLQEVMAQEPYNKGPSEILLIGRDFMDRFEDKLNKFIDNSSTVTDLADPNVGRKSIVVAFEDASITTDPWLLEPVSQLGGQTVLWYLTQEFSI